MCININVDNNEILTTIIVITGWIYAVRASKTITKTVGMQTKSTVWYKVAWCVMEMKNKRWHLSKVNSQNKGKRGGKKKRFVELICVTVTVRT